MSAVSIFAAIVAFVLCFCNISKGQHAPAGGYDALPNNNRNEEARLRYEKASEVISFMNISADPCKDFYDFACGNWENKHETVLHKNRVVTAEHLLEGKINKELQHLLEAPRTPEDDGNTMKAKEFYQICNRAQSTSPAQHNFLLNFVKQFGGLALVPGTKWQNNYNWLQTVALMRAEYGIEVLIGLQIDINLQTLRGNSIYLTEPRTTVLPVDLCSKVANQKADLHEREYEAVQQEVSRNMQKWLSLRQPDAHRFAGDIIRFEFALCKQMRKEQALSNEAMENEIQWGNQRGGAFNSPLHRTGQGRLHGTKQSNGVLHMTLHQLHLHFAKEIDFKNFLQIILDKPINDQVYLRSEGYFRHLIHLVNSNSKLTLANYIMYKALASFNFPTDDRPHKRSTYCVELVRTYFPKVMSEMFSRKFKRLGAFAEIQALYRDIKLAL